jgi:hypothetical protein
MWTDVSEERTSSVLKSGYQQGSNNELTAEVMNLVPCSFYVNRRFGLAYRLRPRAGISKEQLHDLCSSQRNADTF